MNKKKIISFALIAVLAVSLCACRQAKRADYNITQEAENFNIYRRLTVIDCITGQTLYTVEGKMNIKADTEDNQLEVIVETGKGKYKKHLFGISDNMSYIVEDISGSEVSKYHYEINFNPKLWIPYKPTVSD